MGVSIEVYRVHIGTFNPHCGSICKTKTHCKKSQTGISSGHIPVLVLLALLLIAGIEPNPGPVFPCPVCKLSYKSINEYAAHVNIHRSRKGKYLGIPCCFGCNVNFKTPHSLQSHITRHHRKKKQEEQPLRVNVTKKVQSCPVCQHGIESRPEYMKHMVKHLQSGSFFKCPLCSSRKNPFNDVSKFRVHTSRHHPDDHRDFDPAQDEAMCTEPGVIVTAMPQLADSTAAVDTDAEDVAMDFGFGQDATDSEPEDTSSATLPDFFEKDELYPEYMVKDELARFYLKLEGKFVLPTTQVQAIAEENKLISELIHHRLKKALKQELIEAGIVDSCVSDRIVSNTFKQDPIFNIHHRHEDVEQMGTHHMRQKYWRKHFPYVEPKQIRVGTSDTGKARYAHYVSIRESIMVKLRDQKVKILVKKSFERECSSFVLSDYHDGSAFAEHMKQHPGGKCFQLLLFQDEFDFSALGPSQGKYKPDGFYFSLGNLPPEYRTKVDLIQLAYMIIASDLKPTVQEELLDHDKLKAALKPLIEELIDLKINGIDFDGEIIPVCLLFLIGDSLGQHQVGGFVKNFNSEFACRFCPMSRTDFKANPFDLKPLRTPEEYDEAIDIAKRKWRAKRIALLNKTAKKVKRLRNQPTLAMLATCSRPKMRTILKKSVSKDGFKKMCAVNFRGVKYRPSPFNSEALNFHVCSPALAPDIAHDIHEGLSKVVLAGILKYFIIVKEWFDLETLNRRIKGFKCKGSDTGDAPAPLKSLEKLNGNAVQNWNLLRLLPFMIGDLIKDEDDPMWKLYLSLKEIVEYVSAPKITTDQVTYLRILIRSYLNMVKTLLPATLIPKHHFLCHYPDLILIFGPLIRLFTLRFESMHMFFKDVMRACKSHVNVTKTLAGKYVSYFAYNHSSGIIPPDVEYDPSKANPLDLDDFTEDQRAAFSEDIHHKTAEVLTTVTVKSTKYTTGQVLILNRDGTQDLKIGCIDRILLINQTKVIFLLKECIFKNSLNGYYYMEQQVSKESFCLKTIEDLPDFYPLPIYEFQQKKCISLKHTAVCMM